MIKVAPPEILSMVAVNQSVAREKLKPVSNFYEVGSEVLEWSKAFVNMGQCYNNALVMTDVDNCDYVLGFLYIPVQQMIIAHAWNLDDTGHFDLTSQLYWKNRHQIEHYYIELLRLNPTQTEICFKKAKGLHHEALRNLDELKEFYT
ncbi:hypothetical protein F0267_01200 [Vibrio coralliilyticus]|uniref:Uncharacterized protein n=1 Tax=Vibrio coralliilyticus TaxID=190893 RepID=A0AAN0SGM5_9VIBR|nr:hypothetical protein [Vibrio coralliilyticus]AIW22284.1 hypothetical protein IX92_24760 [Vibrio coralliilyticus]NOH36839.1 hypothetical protein [Vibrio coralliilyticus]